MMNDDLMWTHRRKTAVLTDKRIRLMGEIIAAMKLIKVYCWEKSFSDVVKTIRRREIGLMKWTSLLKGTNSALFFVACRIMMYATFMVHIFRGQALTAETVFVTMALFNALRLPVTNQFPNAVGLAAEALVACKRIQKILLLPEKERISINRFDFDGSIQVHSFSGKWNKGSSINDLKNITLDIQPHSLAVVAGAVGSGKSCFLHALMNEIERTSGSCEVRGHTSYAPQESWCFMGSIRENITLGETSKAFDQNRYNEVIRVCCLDRDLALFPEGDRTFVGEKGYTLSGGQKARVSLARAVYNEADIYLLDDPLSAVDPQVAHYIFDECIKKFLKNKTVVLVTHQLQFLEHADQIVLMKDGGIQISGSFTDVIKSGIDLGDHTAKKEEVENEEKVEEEAFIARPRNTTLRRSRRMSRISRRSSVGTLVISPDSGEAEDMDEDDEEETYDVHAESRSEGSVKLRVYWDYIRSGANIPFVICLAITLVMPQVIYQYTDLWLSHWTIRFENVSKSSSLDDEMGNVATYSGLIIALFVSAFLRVICLYLLCLRCSIRLHDTIFSKLLRAPTYFFEMNPVGRILNRFTRDLGQIDQKVPATVDDLIGVNRYIFV